MQLNYVNAQFVFCVACLVLGDDDDDDTTPSLVRHAFRNELDRDDANKKSGAPAILGRHLQSSAELGMAHKNTKISPAPFSSIDFYRQRVSYIATAHPRARFTFATSIILVLIFYEVRIRIVGLSDHRRAAIEFRLPSAVGPR